MSANPPIESPRFIDTNVLVYAYDSSAKKKHSMAARLVEQCWQEENGCISIQVLQELYVTVTGKIRAPLDNQVARQLVQDLSRWRVHTPDANDILGAIDLQEAYQLSFWDAMILQSAASLGCTRLYSEDMSHGETYGKVKVLNPFMEK